MSLEVIDMLKGSRRWCHDDRNAGAVATEFALLMAFVPLTVIAFGIVDYGEFMAQATNLSAIIRGAAEYARGQVVQGNALPTAANLNTLLGVPAEVFTTSSFCTCADNTSVTCPGAGEPNPCAANTDMRVLKYVGVSGSQTYTPIVSGTWPFPPSVNARTVLRTQ
jgi:Flp pilus assembly protein TadG